MQIQTCKNTNWINKAGEHTNPKQQVVQIDPSELIGILHAFPETREIQKIVDQKCHAIHKDEKQKDFVQLFQRIIDDNDITDTPMREKADLLFAFDNLILLERCLTDKQIQHLTDKIFNQLRRPLNSPQVRKLIDVGVAKVIQERINTAHSTFPQFVIAKTLEASLTDISIPSNNYADVTSLKLRLPQNIPLYVPVSQ